MRAFGLLATVLLLLGCASTDPRYYLVEPAPGSPATTDAPAVITVRAVQVPRYLDRSEIVRASGGGRLKVAENDWWGEPLRIMLRRTLAADLAQRLPHADVVDTEMASGDRIDVQLDVNGFEPDVGGTVVLTGYLAIEARKTQRLRRIAIRIVPAGGSVRDQVEAMGQALGHAADVVVAMVRP